MTKCYMCYVCLYTIFTESHKKHPFYRAMLRKARHCHGKLSVRLSVTLKCRGHMGWISWKISSRLINLTFLRSETPTSGIYSKGMQDSVAFLA